MARKINKPFPTKGEYEKALETIRLFEKREKQLLYVKEELAKKLKEFTQVKFKVNKKEGEVLFSGAHTETGKLFIGKSVCSKGDKFELNIGKLISVKKALGENVDDIVELVETHGNLFIYANGDVRIFSDLAVKSY